MDSSSQLVRRFLNSLFKGFEENSLSYSVLRNYKELPDSLGGSDLDLAILPDNQKQVGILISDLVSEMGGRVICDYTTSGRFIRILGVANGGAWGVAIDLFTKMEYKGIEYISAHAVIERSTIYRGIFVSLPQDANLIALLKELLANGKPRKNYYAELAHLPIHRVTESVDALCSFFSNELREKIIGYVDSAEEFGSSLAVVVSSLRKFVYLKGLRTQPCSVLENIYVRFRKMLKPPGFCVAFSGTDGSGKSAVIAEVIPSLELALHSKVGYEHLRPNLLPAIGSVLGRRGAGKNVNTDPHGGRQSGMVGSILRLLYYTVDYVFGFWIRIYPRLIKRPHITIFDRYFYDVIVDPKRMKMSIPTHLMQGIFGCCPKPSLVIVLGGDASVIYQRKPETSLDEVKRQIEAYRELCNTEKSVVWVDTCQSIDRTVQEVLVHISKSMSERSY